MNTIRLEFVRVLILEDLKEDVDLMIRQVRQVAADFEVFTARNREEFEQGLREFNPSLILADYLIPGFDGMEALFLAREHFPFVPFIFVTGTLNNEELAAQTVLSGASEFVLKNNLKRLSTVIAKVLSPAYASKQIHTKFEADRYEVDRLKQEIEQYEARLAEMKAELEKGK